MHNLCVKFFFFFDIAKIIMILIFFSLISKYFDCIIFIFQIILVH